MTPRPSDMTLVERLVALRDSLSPPTSAALADLLGVEQPTANRWLNGKVTPGPDKAPRLAEVLGLPLDEVDALIARTSRRTNRANGDARLSALERDVASMRDAIEGNSRHLRQLAEAVQQLVQSGGPKRRSAR